MFGQLNKGLKAANKYDDSKVKKILTVSFYFP